MNLSDGVAAIFIECCRDELQVPKPGNVHVVSDDGPKTANEFIRSAEAAAPALSARGARIGRRIFEAVQATRSVVPHNTNLGIILLCAPLAAAAEQDDLDLRVALGRALRALDVTDAELAFRAIVTAAPGGLGRTERHDVFEPATATLREAMLEAAPRDRIARQYATDFEDVFTLGIPALEAALARRLEPKWTTLSVFLHFLSAFSDSHIVREHGPAVAEEVRNAALDLLDAFQRVSNPAALVPELVAYDKILKARAINPGTSADLTVGTLFAIRLQNFLPFARNND